MNLRGRFGAASSGSLYVAVGASDSVGVGAAHPRREAWPLLFHRRALPTGTRFANLAVSGATVADALRRQIPRALALSPQLVTVWLAVNDLVADVEVGAYESDLGQLVHRLRRQGNSTVLVANVPYLDHLPAYLQWRAALPDVPAPDVLNAVVEAYNNAIERVARHTGAVVVDLHAAALAARRAGREAGLISGDGFHPSTAGHAAIAEAFAGALTGLPTLVAGH